MDPLRLTSFKTIFRSFKEVLPCFWIIENHLYISGKTTKSSEASRASGSGELWQSYQWRNQREGTHQDEPEGVWWLQRVRPGGLSVVWKVKYHLKRESPIRLVNRKCTFPHPMFFLRLFYWSTQSFASWHERSKAVDLKECLSVCLNHVNEKKWKKMSSLHTYAIRSLSYAKTKASQTNWAICIKR